MKDLDELELIKLSVQNSLICQSLKSVTNNAILFSQKHELCHSAKAFGLEVALV